VTPTLENFRVFFVSGACASNNEALSINSSASLEYIKMKLSCSHCKICRINNHLSSSLIQQKSVFREADVIANTNSNFTILCIKDGNLGWSSSDIFTFIESNASWNIDIKQMLFPVLSNNLTFFIETEAGIVNLFLTLDFFWKASTNDVFIKGLR